MAQSTTQKEENVVFSGFQVTKVSRTAQDQQRPVNILDPLTDHKEQTIESKRQGAVVGTGTVHKQASVSSKAEMIGQMPVPSVKQASTGVQQRQDDSPVKLNKKGKRIGRWSPEEHELFLEALRIYAKDWTMIELHVKTRDVTNIRAHAQKFLLKLVKLLNKDENDSSHKEGKQQQIPPVSAITTAGIGNNDDEPMTTEQLTNAEIYYSILKQKMHKSFSKNLKENLKQKEKDAMAKAKQMDTAEDAKAQTSPS